MGPEMILRCQLILVFGQVLLHEQFLLILIPQGSHVSREVSIGVDCIHLHSLVKRNHNPGQHWVLGEILVTPPRHKVQPHQILKVADLLVNPVVWCGGVDEMVQRG